MESGKRKNPPRGARPRSSDVGSRSAERAVRGRATPSRGQGAASASTSDEGIPAPLHTHTVSCPPLSHRERVHSQAVPDPVQECWLFLAKPLKIEFEFIPNDNTRNVLGIS